MKVERLYFEGCPGYQKAERALRDALSGAGFWAQVVTVLVSTAEEAERLRFPGSPTVRLDGRDLFPEGLKPRTSWYLGCRIYHTPDGPKDHPTAEMIRSALLRRKER